MPWFKGDDKFHDQPELVYLSDSAVCLFWCALSWCSSAGTDGFVPAGQVPRLKGGNDETAQELCKSYLGKPPWWEQVNGGFRIRSFLKFNPSAAKIQVQRQYESARKAKQRGAKCPAGTHTGTPDGSHAAPVPVPLTTKSSNNNGSKSSEKLGAWDRFLSVYPKRSGDRGIAKGRDKFMSLLKSGQDPELVISGVERYAQYCQARGIAGTEYVKQIPSFLNGSCWLEEFTLPKEESRPQQVNRLPKLTREAS